MAMNDIAPLRVLQVGCGGITGAWLPPALQMPDIEFVGLCDLFPAAAEKLRDQYEQLPADLPIFDNLNAALSELQPDAIFDCTIPAAHTPNAIAAIESGAHVVSEKPLAENLGDARRAIDAAQANGKIYAITQNYRYANGPRRLKAFLDAGHIGAVTTVNADMYLGAHFGGFRDEMRHVLLLDMAIHTFDMTRFLSGADATSVFCHEWNPRGSWYAHDASASAIFEMNRNIVANFRGSWCATGLPTGFASSWRIIGERGTVVWDGAENFGCEVEDGDAGFFRPVKSVEVPGGEFGTKAAGHGGILREFVDAIRGGAAPETNAADNFNSLQMVLGAIESSEGGRRVELG